MNHDRRNGFVLFVFATAFFFLLASCSNIPLIGKKEDKEKIPPGKIVTVDGMETVKGINTPRQEASPSKTSTTRTPPAQPAPVRKEAETKTASAPSRTFYGSGLPLFQSGFKKKVAVLDFENKTNYKDEKIGEAVAKRLSDKLESTQRIVTVDRTVIETMLAREGARFESLSDLPAMKKVHQSMGIQAFALGTVTDVSLLSSKASDTSDEEMTFATAKVEIRLIDASTGNLLKTFIGRSPIFGTKEIGEYSRSKSILKAIDFGLEDILEGFLRQLDLLEWTTTIAKIDGDSLYLNAGKLSGLRIGDTFEVFEPGKEIIHPSTQLSLGWTNGQMKGTVRVTDLFGVDAAVGKIVQGKDLSSNDVVKSPAR
jgi:hypothetical protein